MVAYSSPNRFLCKPYGDLTAFSSPQGHCEPCVFLTSHSTFFRNINAATTPQVHLKVTSVALRWPWGDICFSPCFGCLENRTAGSRRPCGGLTMTVRRNCGSCNNREGVGRSSFCRLSWIVRSPCSRRNICDNYYRQRGWLWSLLKLHLFCWAQFHTFEGLVLSSRGVLFQSL